MKEGNKAIVTNPFHAYYGRTGIITEIGTDDQGDFVYLEIKTEIRKDDVMFEANDIKVFP